MSSARALVSCAVAGAVLAGSTLAAQSVLTGTVRGDSTGRPLSGVDVTVAGSDKRTTTDNAGRYVLNLLPAGRRMVLFRSIGYRPVQEWVVLGSSDTVWVNPMMVPGTVRLDPIVVTAVPDAPHGLGLEAFEERRRLGFGKFIDSTVLRRSEHRLLTHLLEAFPGIGFDQLPIEGSRARVAYSTRREGPRCYLSVYLDGVPLYISVAPGAAPTRPLVDLNMFDTASLAAVEVYRSPAEVPPEYGGAGGGCGVVLLWTRRG